VTETAERFGTFDFGLSAEQEERARRLHAEAIVIDTLFQGPCGRRSFTAEMVAEVEADYERHRHPERGLFYAVQMPVRRAIRGEFPDFEACWRAAGITAGNRQTGMMTLEQAFEGFALAQAQFDHLPWLVKALRAEDFRRAKREGRCAGFVSTQNTVAIGLELNWLDRFYELGMRMIQLTYNSMNHVGAGCTERTDAGVSEFGVQLIKRMNQLGMIVDTGHCGRQTTLDACAISDRPVVASHTSAQGVYHHDRGKSDAELKAIAATGGYIGVYAVPFFLTGAAEATVEHFLDHIDYIARLVGPQHVGIGTDWPMQAPEWGLRKLDEWSTQIGFRAEHNLNSLRTLVGFDDYRDYPNFTRGLVKRGYSDPEIKGILGENFLRVFEQVCG